MTGLIKSVIAKIFYLLGVWRILYWLKAKLASNKLLVVFTFHRITDVNDNRHYYLNYDRGQDSDEFYNQIKAISKYFNVVNLETYIDIITGKQKPRTHTALLTFDDADSEFQTQAFPILKQFNCPSVVFTPTDYVETDRRFWHLRLSNVMENINSELWDKLRDNAGDLPESIKSIILNSNISDISKKTSTCQALADELDELKLDDIDRVIDKLEEIIGKQYTLGIKCLSWDEHKKLTGEGVRFDSHTVNHRKLAKLDISEIEFELTESKLELEKQLGTEVLSICYPAGSFNDKVVALAPECGYSVGFSTRVGICGYPKTGKDLFTIPRLIMYGKKDHEIGLFMFKILLGLYDLK